jgi:hypothetical protein
MVFMLEKTSVQWGKGFHRVAPETSCLLLQAADLLGQWMVAGKTEARILFSASQNPLILARTPVAGHGVTFPREIDQQRRVAILIMEVGLGHALTTARG